jgi:hypothetical protein
MVEVMTGSAVIGVTFASGHVLGLRHWATTSYGPAYTAVWHRDPTGRWQAWSTTPGDHGCSRYIGRALDASNQSSIDVRWLDPDTLAVNVERANLNWTIRLERSFATKALSALLQVLPAWATRNERILRVAGPVAGRILSAGRMNLTGLMPNGQTFRMQPNRIWLIAENVAVLDGADLGSSAPLPEQAALGDFLIPGVPLFATGSLAMR